MHMRHACVYQDHAEWELDEELDEATHAPERLTPASWYTHTTV